MFGTKVREAETEVDRITERLGRPMTDDELAFYDRLALRHDALLIARMPGVLVEMAPSGALDRASRNWAAIQSRSEHDRLAQMAIVDVVAESAEAVMLSR
jgi:hypothetical protein